jgi:hypothetical protein
LKPLRSASAQSLQKKALSRLVHGRLKNLEWKAANTKKNIRWQTAEHLFGTVKSWMGSTHFLMK